MRVVDLSELPEQWATWANQAGVRPSMTGIGEAADVPASTVSRLIRGRTTKATVKAVADALRITEAQILAAVEPQTLGPWSPPMEAHLLTSQERDALGVLIRGLTQDRGVSDGRQPEDQKSADEGLAYLRRAARGTPKK